MAAPAELLPIFGDGPLKGDEAMVIEGGAQSLGGRMDDICLQIVDRFRLVGLAVAIVGGDASWLRGFGVARDPDVPVTSTTVFRVASLSKTMTAVAVMQLVEQGRLRLDDPANDHLRTFRLESRDPSFPPVTIRHLLTHTAGIGEVRGVSDLFRPVAGLAQRADRPLPSLGEYYRGGLRVEVAPGTKWVYANHGYAALGQLVEDMSGQPFADYMRQAVFEPLGMRHTDFTWAGRPRADVATGYRPGRHGPKPAPDFDTIPVPAGAAYSTPSDMARYLTAIANRGANANGRVLSASTMDLMLSLHYRSDARLDGMGLGFFLQDISGHRAAWHSGGWSGFSSWMLVVPDSGAGVVALSNGGSWGDSMEATRLVAERLMREVLNIDDPAPEGLRDRPDVWPALRGYYGPEPGLLTNSQTWTYLGGGLEIGVRRHRLTARALSTDPELRHGIPLEPDDADDPFVFRLPLRALGVGDVRVAFETNTGGRAIRLHFDQALPSLHRRSSTRNPRVRLQLAVAALSVVGSLFCWRRVRAQRRTV